MHAAATTEASRIRQEATAAAAQYPTLRDACPYPFGSAQAALFAHTFLMRRTANTGRMVIYLAGPMTGLPDYNRPAFIAEADRLRALGYTVVNPAELDATHPIQDPAAPDAWHQYMRRDIAQLVRCHGIALMPGWEQSKGATLEAQTAEALLIPARLCSAITAGPVGTEWPAQECTA
jgi:hypothetical protein